MDDEFLNRLRETPPHDFIVALKAKLDRQSAKSFSPAARSVRNLLIALLFGGAVVAAATISMRGGVRAVYEQQLAVHTASAGLSGPATAAGSRISAEQASGPDVIRERRGAQSAVLDPATRTTIPISAESDATVLPSGFTARIEARQPSYWKGEQGTLLDVMQKYGVPGVSVAVINDFEVDWARGYGVADTVTRQPVASDTLFQAGGLSQFGAAIAVLKAAEQGRLSLDADINDILKSWKVPKSPLTERVPVTLRALLSHTSGAEGGWRSPGYDPAELQPTLVQIIEGERPFNLAPIRFAHPPFTSYEYTGAGPAIAQLAMTDALGASFETIMKFYVLGPLGMKDSTYEQPIPRALESRAATGHDFQGIPMKRRWSIYPEQATAGLWSTADDLAQLAREIQRALNGSPGRVLSMEMAREMVTPVGVGPFAPGGFIPRSDGRYVEHGGCTRGFHSALFADRDGYGLIVLTNGDNGRKVIDEIEARVTAAYAWEPLEKTDSPRVVCK